MEAAQLPDGRGGPHAFVDDLSRPALGDADRHHLERALRLRRGDPLTVSDGRGRWRPVRFGVGLEPDGDIVEVARLEPRLGVAFSLVKAGRPESIVQKLTEVGIDVIHPLVAARSVVRWDETRTARHEQRLTAIAREAAMQCRRVWLPELRPVTTPAALATEPGVARAERGGDALGPGVTLVLVGPEGGWSDDELALAVPNISLGSHVLRSETAAMVAGALMCALRAGTVTPRAGSPPRVS